MCPEGITRVCGHVKCTYCEPKLEVNTPKSFKSFEQIFLYLVTVDFGYSNHSQMSHWKTAREIVMKFKGCTKKKSNIQVSKDYDSASEEIFIAKLNRYIILLTQF